jgi:hypothetical protein
VEGVIVKDLIINYFHVYKIFFGKAISEIRKKKKDLIAVNRTSVNAKTVFFWENLIIFRILFKVIITLKDSVEFRGLINIGAEINYIDKAIYKQLSGVIIILNLNIEMVSYSNHRVLFMRIYKNVRLAVKLIKYDVCLFIIDIKTSYFLVLGIPFIFQSNLSLGTEKDTGR